MEIDGSGKIVFPGLINTHHHLFQSFVRNLKTIDLPNMTLVEWLDKIYRVFVNLTSEAIYYASLTSLADLVKHGCTTVFDHQYCYTPYTKDDPIARQMTAAEELGVRLHAGRGTNTLPRQEGSTIPDGMLETTEEFIEDTRRLIQKYHDTSRFSMHDIVIAPCQPINCYKDTFVESVRLARETGARLHTHLGEGENAIMVERWGKRTLDWCEEIGFIGENVWFAHCIELTDDEFSKLSAYGSGIAHCPEALMVSSVPILPLKRLKDLGVTVGIGCDGSATNDGSSLLSSIRVAYLLQAFYSKERGGCVSAYDVLKAATCGGAKLLGRSDIGALEVGKAADLFMLDVSTLDLVGTKHDPKNLIGRVGPTGPVWLTMINGKIVFQENRFSFIDERSLAKKGEALCEQILSQIPGLIV